MKKILKYSLCSLFFISCSTSNECIKSYLKDEIQSNKNNNIESLLLDCKKNPSILLKAYSAKNYDTENFTLKNFNQMDYNMLNLKLKNDTIKKYWNESNSKYFYFKSLTKFDEKMEFRKNLASKLEVYIYSISKPIFLNRNKAMFGLSIIKKSNNIYDSYLIIMKNENRKWIIDEKVQSLLLY
ncbi:hypothetical protein [Flavobacterium sp.]|uniref:hypothetical protein n=1 Tax=Flavobacterium sp. TaxID=239 RepID=UPI0037509F80